MCYFNDNRFQQLRTDSSAGVCLINEGQPLDSAAAHRCGERQSECVIWNTAKLLRKVVKEIYRAWSRNMHRQKERNI